MGMTKARVFPLPVTCGGRRFGSAFPHSSLWGEAGGQAAVARHSPLLPRRLCFSGTEGWWRTEERDGKAVVREDHDPT